MSADALLAWKAKIATYQQQVKASLSAKQDTLFELASAGYIPGTCRSRQDRPLKLTAATPVMEGDGL